MDYYDESDIHETGAKTYSSSDVRHIKRAVIVLGIQLQPM